MERRSLVSAFQKLLFGRLNEGQKIVALLFAILVALLLILYFNYRLSKIIGKNEVQPPFLLGPAALNPQPETPLSQPEKTKGEEPLLRDPFIPGDSMTSAGYKVELKLESILIDPYNPAGSLAVINGQPVKVGERIQGAVIFKIEPEKVILKQGEKELVLQLWTE